LESDVRSPKKVYRATWGKGRRLERKSPGQEKKPAQGGLPYREPELIEERLHAGRREAMTFEP